MVKTGYERYGLSGNPFRDLSSENLEDIELYHVTQSVDADIQSIRDEALEKENKAVIALLGGLGAGKTERLLLLKKEAMKKGAFWAMGGVTTETSFMIRGILESILENSKAMKKSKFVTPLWLRKVQKSYKRVLKEYDPDEVGSTIANAMNANAPSFLLINDLHRLPEKEDMEQFLQTLYVITNKIQPGVLVVLSGDERYFQGVMIGHPTLNERINRKLVIPRLTNQEASLVVAKRLLAKRLVDDMDALYPFTPEAIGALNAATKGNPRMLLKFADHLIDNAVKARVVQIDDDIVKVMFEQKDTVQLLYDSQLEGTQDKYGHSNAAPKIASSEASNK